MKTRNSFPPWKTKPFFSFTIAKSSVSVMVVTFLAVSGSKIIAAVGSAKIEALGFSFILLYNVFTCCSSLCLQRQVINGGHKSSIGTFIGNPFLKKNGDKALIAFVYSVSSFPSSLRLIAM